MAANCNRNVLAVLAFALLGFATSSPEALGQGFPSKPIHFVVPFPPGGIDTVARLLAGEVSQTIGQPVVVENRAGANGMIGTEYVTRADADGHTLLFATSSTLISGTLMMKAPPLQPLRDLTPVSITYRGMSVVAIDAKLPVKSLNELVDYAKRNPGKLNYSTSGVGSVFHFYGEAIKEAAGGMDWVHVPYKGTGPSLQALLSGEVQVGFPSLQGILPSATKGTHRILAVVGSKRVPRLKDVPTVREVLPSFEDPASWIGVFAPAGLAQPVLERLSAAFVKAAQMPKVLAYMEAGGNELMASSYEEARAILKRDFEAAVQLMKRAGIQPQ